mmetsp:Transcript_23025/g.36664  ORF Transcript_23025/g.36664 Transcript_23025/m.36664 type:complete len:101 (+) Transcript_23025:2425-2727(+)
MTVSRSSSTSCSGKSMCKLCCGVRFGTRRLGSKKTHHRYRDVEKGQYKFSVRPDNYEREKGKVEERKRVILEIVGELVERCPNMQDDLRMIASSLFSEDA